MQKVMTAKYPGKCAISGARINPGDEITFDTITRKAWFTEPGDCQVVADNSNCLQLKNNMGNLCSMLSPH